MLAIGVDLGGSKTKAALVNLSNMTAETWAEVPTPEDHQQLIRALKKLVAQIGGEGVPVGVGVAGQVKQGVVVSAPNIKGIKEFPLADALANSLKVQVRIANDVQVAGIGTAKILSLGGTGVCIMLGTGVGGAIVVDGTLLKSLNGLAGELGHLAYKPGGDPCGCGRLGCLEAYLGWNSIREKAKKIIGAVPVNPRQLLSFEHPATTSLINEAREAARWLMDIILATLDPQWVAIGGGLLAAWPFLEDDVRREAEAWQWKSFKTPNVLKVPKEAATIGAALLVAKKALYWPR